MLTAKYRDGENKNRTKIGGCAGEKAECPEGFPLFVYLHKVMGELKNIRDKNIFPIFFAKLLYVKK